MHSLVTGFGKQLLRLNASGAFPSPCQLVSAILLGVFQQLSELLSDTTVKGIQL